MQVDKMTKWGDLESEEEESEEEEEEEEPEEDTESLADGIASSLASGYNSSLPSGIETPEVIDLRKGKAGGFPSLLRGLHQEPVHFAFTSTGIARHVPVNLLLMASADPMQRGLCACFAECGCKKDLPSTDVVKGVLPTLVCTGIRSPVASLYSHNLQKIVGVKHVHDRTLCAGAGDRPLYQVLEQQQAQVGGNLMGSDHTYIIPGGKPAPGKKCAPQALLSSPHASGSLPTCTNAQ